MPAGTPTERLPDMPVQALCRGAVPGAAVAVAVALLAVPAATSAAAAPPADLTTAEALGAATVAPGGTLQVAARAANRGRGRARSSVTRFYLSPDPRASAAARRASRTDPRTSAIDVGLGGEVRVPALRAGARGPRRTARVTVPETLRPGAWVLLACADDTGRVPERRETNQCRAARGRVTVAGGAAAPPWRSLTDELPVLDDARIAERASFVRSMSCTPPVAVRPVRDAKAAIAGARAALTAQVGAPAMQAFAASPEAASAGSAQVAALTTLMAGNLGGALVSALRAAELAPRDGDRLADAAALAVSAGLPNEALALIDGAAVAGRPAPLALGLDRRAAAAQIRGMALLQLGRDQDALGQLRAAATLDPSLAAESASGQAAQALCAKAPQAAALFKRAGRRSESPPVPLDEQAGGQATALRPIELPGTPGEAVRMEGQLQAAKDAMASETTALHAAEARNAADERARTPAPVERRRQRVLLDRLATVGQRPEVLAAGREVEASIDRQFRIVQDFWGGGSSEQDQQYRYKTLSSSASEDCTGKGGAFSACWYARMRETCTPALRGHHQTWLAEVVRGRQAQADLLAATSRAMTGIAAHLGDPVLRERVRLQVAGLELVAHGNAVIDAAAWARRLKTNERACVQSPDGTQDASSRVGATAPAVIAPGSPCDAVNRNVSFVLDPGKLLDGFEGSKQLPRLPKVKVSCERVQVSYEFGPSSWAQAFVQVDWKFRAGTVTAFAGVRGKVDFTTRADKVKAGLYLTASRDGVEDVGWRLSQSTETPLGPVLEVALKKDWDLSMVPALQDLGALVGKR
jgi:tetratricopeptide (TPR) repeat protein